MTAKSTTIDTSAAIRHAVYADLLGACPIASRRQAAQFAANLALTRNRLHPSNIRERGKAIDRIMLRLLLLRVTPDLAEVDRFRGLPKGEIETSIAAKYGDRLRNIPGFYFEDRWRVNLPEGCALYGYRSNEGFYTGILCQPLNRIDYFFLLSSRGQGGFSPVRMTDSTRDFFERFKLPVELPPAAEAIRRSLTPFESCGFRWTGRRFREVKPTGNK